MRLKIVRTLMAGGILLAVASTACAADLTFILSGQFDLNLGGQDFEGIDLTLQGTGSSPKGLTTAEGDPFIQFSLLQAVVLGFGTFEVPSSIVFYFNPGPGAGAGEGGFIDTSTGQKVLTLHSPAFIGYDAGSSLTASGLTFGSAQGFETRYGTARIVTASNLALTTRAAAVPEPATWAMLVGGFGVIGGAMRRRARPTVAFA